MSLLRVFLITVVGVAGVTAPLVLAQTGVAGQGIESLTSTRESLLVTYEEGATVTVQLEGTQRLPGGEGRAEVQRRPGVTELAAQLDKMKPATLFGGDFSTYVLWTVSPEGLAVNVGEFVLDGEKSELRVTSPLDMFGLFITAEPHALVRMPSRFVVLDNTGAGVRRGRATTRSVEYRGFDGAYEFERESLIRQDRARGKQRVERQQAAIAIALAERAGAATYAPAELWAANGTYARMTAAFDSGAGQAERVLLAHETIRLAIRAEDVAKASAAAAALEAERQAAQTEIDTLTQARAEATRATQLAQEAAARLEALRIQAQQEADEARTEARRYAQLRDEARTQAERDRLAAEEARVAQQEALRAQAAAETATRQAQLEQRAARALAEQSRQEAERLAALRAEAQTEAARALGDAEEARGRMERALGLVADTRETARGLTEEFHEE